jgi:hypothetical protein
MLELVATELEDGWIEAELSVGAERAFHGVVWRVVDEENYESFFVRPHQVGNHDAVQYTPVQHGISSWQLYHGDGFWAPVRFPVGGWFRIRVVFAGQRAETFIDGERILVSALKRPSASGRVGVLEGGPGLEVGEVTWGDDADIERDPPPAPQPPEGVVRQWEVSDPLPEGDRRAERWTRIDSEPGGLLDLSRLHGIREGKNSVLARTTIKSNEAEARILEFGFSDRASVWLNGTPLFDGDDTYRSRDYRFLGSIGWYYRLHLPLRAGENELVFVVAEDFGGWGLQARLVD